MEGQNNEVKNEEIVTQNPEVQTAESVEEPKPAETQPAEAVVQPQVPEVSASQEPSFGGDRRKRRRRGKKFGIVGRKKEAIMSDAELRKKSKKMGGISIALCVISLALVYPLMWLGAQIVIYGFTHFLFVIGNILVVCAGLALPTILFYVQIYQISFMSAQLSIRKDAFGWVCLAISIITVLGIIILGFFSIKPILDTTFGTL